MSVNPLLLHVLLRGHIARALRALPVDAALRVAADLDARRHRVVSEFTAGPDGVPIADSLRMRVEIPGPAGWWPLCSPHWTELGLDLDDVRRELANVLAEAEMGVAPRPDDPQPPAGWAAG